MPIVILQDNKEVAKYSSLSSGDCFELTMGAAIWMKGSLVDDAGARLSLCLADGEMAYIRDDCKVFPLNITEIKLQ